MKKPTESSYQEYTDLFVQRIPRFILKTKSGKRWQTVHKPLGDKIVQAHLSGSRAVGALGKWYPGHAILDIDKREIEQVQEMRSAAGLSESNSMLCSSESSDSYHLLIRPTYRNKPPTVKLLDEIFQPFCDEHDVEIYPQAQKCARLPFGKIQQCLDEGMELINNWAEKTYWFQKLDQYDLACVPGQQLIQEPLEKQKNIEGPRLSTFQRGQELFQHGLQAPSSRHESQYEVLYYLWRKNVPQEEAERITLKWIKQKNNGYSADIVSSPRMVNGEIRRQAEWVYSHFTHSWIYPDSTHNQFSGYTTKEDIIDIFKISKGSLPKARFLFNLIKYYYPRRYRNRINVHSNLLKSWASRDTYIGQIGELEQKGIIYRGENYIVNVRSKEIKMRWPWRSLDDAILIDDRAPDTLEQTIRVAFTKEEARALLRSSGMHKMTISRYIRGVFTTFPCTTR